MKKGNFSGQFLMIYDDANITIELNKLSEFLIFDVKLSEIKLNQNKVIHDIVDVYLRNGSYGNDVMVDWEFEGLNFNNSLWHDANGLQMVHKKLWHRGEYNFSSTNIASQFFPITSALVARDGNK